MHSLRNWSAFLLLYAGLASCSAAEIESLFSAIDNVGQQPAAASIATGFQAGDYPARNHAYDAYMPKVQGLSQQQLSRLFNHVAMPQSHQAMVSILGYPYAEDGAYSYWKIDGGSSELAVYYQGGTAYSYTVGGY